MGTRKGRILQCRLLLSPVAGTEDLRWHVEGSWDVGECITGMKAVHIDGNGNGNDTDGGGWVVVVSTLLGSVFLLVPLSSPETEALSSLGFRPAFRVLTLDDYVAAVGQDGRQGILQHLLPRLTCSSDPSVDSLLF